MRMGVLGGSFDPIHLGHLALAEAARDRLDLDRVLLVVAAGQPLKPRGPEASAEDRYAMVRLAVRGRERLVASDLELRRAAPSYTVETLRQIRREVRPPDEVLLILGADAMADFPRWREAGTIRSLATVVVCRRPSTPPPGGADRILDVDTPDISSTGVRRRVATGQALDGLVPADVAAYIAERRLYGA